MGVNTFKVIRTWCAFVYLYLWNLIYLHQCEVTLFASALLISSSVAVLRGVWKMMETVKCTGKTNLMEKIITTSPFKYTQSHIANRYKGTAFQCNSPKLNFWDYITRHMMLYTAEESCFLEVTSMLFLSTSLVVIYSIMLVLCWINETVWIAWIAQVFYKSVSPESSYHCL